MLKRPCGPSAPTPNPASAHIFEARSRGLVKTRVKETATATFPAAAHAAPPVHSAAGRFDPCAGGSRSRPCRRAGRDRALASPMASTGSWRNLGSMVHLLGHATLGVLLRFAGLGVEFAGALGAMFPERDHPEQKGGGGRRQKGVVGGGFHPERKSHRQRETEQ